MPEVIPVAKFLTETVLAPIFADGLFRFPPPASTALLSANFREVIGSLRVSLISDQSRIAGIRDRHIRLPAGFFCERWCTSYRLAKVYHAVKGAMDEYDVWLRPSDVPFEWPDSIPDPGTANDKMVADVNKMFSLVVSGTILHEVGHAIHHDSSLAPQEIELRCDEFAMDYLLGRGDSTVSEVKIVAVSIWLCSICCESLCAGVSLKEGRRHPHPLDRIRAFIEIYVHPYRVEQASLMVAIERFCVVTIWDLARLRCPEAFNDYAMEDFRAEHADDPMAMLQCLRQCWDY